MFLCLSLVVEYRNRIGISPPPMHCKAITYAVRHSPIFTIIL
jgi:hypothetical protein